VSIVLKSGSLNLLEPSEPVQACNGIDILLPFTFITKLGFIGSTLTTTFISGKINSFELQNEVKIEKADIIIVIKSRIIRLVGHVVRKGKRRVAYRILAGKPEGKKLRERRRHIWDDNIKKDLQEIWKLLYVYRVVPPPIIRSTNNCIYSIWYLSHPYCYLPLSWKSWNRY